MITREVLIC